MVHAAGAGVHRVVHEHIDVAPFVEHPRHPAFERRSVEEVHGDLEGAPARLLDQQRRGLEAAGDDAAAVLVVARVTLTPGARRDGNVEAGRGQLHGCGLADASAGPGDEGDLGLHGCVSMTPWTTTFIPSPSTCRSPCSTTCGRG